MGRPKPPISAWIISGRKAKGWKPADLAAALRERGIRSEEGTVRTWEAGRKAADDAIAQMELLFGVQAPRAEAATDNVSVLQAIERQNETLTALVGHLATMVEEMQASREEAHGRGKAFAEILAELRTAVVPASSTSEPPEPPENEGRVPRRGGQPVANGGGR